MKGLFVAALPYMQAVAVVVAGVCIGHLAYYAVEEIKKSKLENETTDLETTEVE